ncbi:MAG: hypothetical protein WCO17_08350 [Betaproteobacteria bacterium]
MTTYPSPSILATVAQMKLEILDDVRNGYVPISITHFGALHDHRDANCYGGFCDDDYADLLIAHFGGRDEQESMPQTMLDFINACQEEVNDWLADGRFAKACECSI